MLLIVGRRRAPRPLMLRGGAVFVVRVGGATTLREWQELLLKKVSFHKMQQNCLGQCLQSKPP